VRDGPIREGPQEFPYGSQADLRSGLPRRACSTCYWTGTRASRKPR
jgi:hypothetical protein